MAIKREFQSFLVEGEEVDEFAEWAFGANYRVFSHAMQAMEAWNIMHGHDLMLKEDDSPAEDIPKMVDLWRNSR